VIDPEGLHKRAADECRLGNWNAALQWVRKAVALRPEEPRFAQSEAIALWCAGKRRRAIAALDRGLQFEPENAGLIEYRARFLTDIGDRTNALDALRSAIRICGEVYPLTRRLAETLSHAGELVESEYYWRKTVGFRPRDLESLSALAGVVCRQGRLTEGMDIYREATRLRGGKAVVPALLLTLHYTSATDPRSIAAAHSAWARWQEKRTPRAPALARMPRRRLRVGYVSGDFRQHSVAHFFEPLLEAHQGGSIEPHCFYTHAGSDRVTARIRKLASGWHDISRLDDAGSLELVRQARIDILVDLSGHTAFNRLPLFACRPAPLQGTYLGYPDTTGLSTIDFRFTDATADPPGMAEPFHSERLIRIDPCFLCYRPWHARAPLSPPPFERNGYLTLGCFAIRQKLSPETLDAWAEILRQSSGTRLALKFRAASEASVRAALEDFFQQRGVAKSRIDFAPATARLREHLEYYSEVDLMLDPFPYNGTTATCEALWMGLPVLTWSGNAHVSRVGATLLNQVSLQQFIANSRDNYIARALDAIRSPQELARYRRRLRATMLRSPLTDSARLARSVESAYWKLWRE